jgi:ABC-type oligopeptide transport system substrate-binding subunit
LLLCLFAFGAAALAVAGPSRGWGGLRQKKADTPDKKRVVEDEEDDPRPIKKRVEAEEETPRKHKVVRPEDDDKPNRPGAEAVDLGQAAREAKHPKVKALFAGLAVPYDEVDLKAFRVMIGGGKTMSGRVRVAPLPRYTADVKELEGKLELKVIDRAGKVLKTEAVGARNIQAIRYYERIAIAEVKEFLEQRFERFAPDSKLYLPRFDQLLAGEQALAAVVRFHQSARLLGVRKGPEWQAVSDELRKQLLDVLLSQLGELTESKAWDQAFGLTRRLAETYTRAEDHKRIAKPVAELLKTALKDPNYTQDRMKEARLRLRQFEDEFPNSDVIKPISDSLREQAQALTGRAKELLKEKKNAEALRLLKQASDTWPELPGLRKLLLETDNSYQILRVNMRELPRHVSPGWAVTDADRRGVELLFESLVDLLPDDQGSLYYRPSLSVGRAKVVPLGRQFKLPRGAKWSDDKPLTVSDLRYTVKLLQDGQGTGRCAAWGNLLSEKGVSVGGDPFRVKLLLRQGFLDPLAAMSFKVLPGRSKPNPTSEAFALKPISSGPFTFGGRLSENGREYVAFLASPYYGVRGDKLGLPRLKEVRVFAHADPVKELKDENIDLALDLTAEQAAALGGAAEVLPSPAEKAVNRRIYFLAVNHRKAALRNADVRVALARAINREEILKEHFRKGWNRKLHPAINGPYPAKSWACNPALTSRQDKTSLDPYDPDLAKTRWKQALPKLGVRELRLTLKYPSGDKQLAAALGELCEKVNKELPGVKLVLEERAPQALREDVEQTHSYDLAYYSYDFPDESYWLEPLLGASGPGGRENYLGYNGSLVGKIQSAATLRHFTQVREYAHAIHRQMLASEMPFIPLWQLDPISAFRKGRVQRPALDPNRPFTEVQRWRVGQGQDRPAAGD